MSSGTLCHLPTREAIACMKQAAFHVVLEGAVMFSIDRLWVRPGQTIYIVCKTCIHGFPDRRSGIGWRGKWCYGLGNFPARFTSPWSSHLVGGTMAHRGETKINSLPSVLRSLGDKWILVYSGPDNLLIDFSSLWLQDLTGDYENSMLDFIWIRVPAMYSCRGPSKEVVAACHQATGLNVDGHVPCWVSRPWVGYD